MIPRPSVRSRRVRFWFLCGAAVAVAVTAALLALPEVLRRVVVTKLGAATGRPVTIEDVDVNLFSRRLMVKSLAVGQPGGAPPLLQFDRLDVRFQFLPLFAGRLEVAGATLERPVLRILRSGPSDVNVADVLAHLLAGRGGLAFAIDRLVLTDGAIVFVDRAVVPSQRWEAKTVRIALRHVTTMTDTASGTTRATFVLAGAPVSVTADRVRLRPLHARMTATVEGLDLGPPGLYVPSQTALRLQGGKLSTRITLEYDARTGLRAGGETTITDLALTRRGQSDPFIVTPVLRLTSRDIAYAGGTVSAGRLEVIGDATVHDTNVSPHQAFAFRAVHVVAEDVSYPAHGSARLTVTAGLPGGARLEAGGTARVFPATADLAVALNGVDLALLRPYLPADAPVTPDGGRLDARLKLRYAGAGPQLAGEFDVTDLTLGRRGQAGPFLTEPRLTGHLAGLEWRDGGVALGRLELSGSPTIRDASVTPPQRHDLTTLSVTLNDVGWPRGGPARLQARARLAGGDTATLEGTVDPATLAADVAATVGRLDLARLRPYLPAGAPLAPARGRLTAALALRHGREAGTRLEGTGTVERLALVRRPDRESFLSIPGATVSVSGMEIEGGTVTIGHAVLSGRGTIVDRSVSPAQSFVMNTVQFSVSGATWPQRGPARVELAAQAQDVGSVTAQGTVGVIPFTADLALGLDDVDLARLRPYLPAAVPVALRGGRLGGRVKLTRGAEGATQVGGNLTLDGIRVAHQGPPAFTASLPRLRVALSGLRLDDHALSIEGIDVEGPSLVVDAGASAGRPLEFGTVRLRAEDVAWPERTPAHLTLAVDVPHGGSVSADGKVALGSRTADLVVVASGIPLEPYARFFPIQAPVAGTLHAALTVVVAPRAEPTVTIRGTADLRNATLGPTDRPAVAVRAIEAAGLELQWPGHVMVQRLVLRRPTALIERDRQGFPLRRMLAPPARGQAAQAGGAGASAAPGRPTTWRTMPLTIRRIDVQGAEARFIDRTTSPFYSEEISRLAITIDGLSTTSGQPARVQAQGIVGTGAALALRGDMQPFGATPFLDVSGEMHDFQVPRVNPYARRLLDWIAESGRLTSRVHYRITGDQLEASNDILVRRLDVAPVGEDDVVERRIGLPLGLIVALLKDASGAIHLSVPVSGKISAPEFSFGDAIARAIRNVVVKAITLPFRLIGRVFSGPNNTIEGLRIDPVRFDPGSSVVSPAIESHLQRIADFLRASPYIRLAMKPVISQKDLQTLRTQTITAHIQKVQRDQRLPDFTSAAVRVFQDRYPARRVPLTVDEIVAILRDHEPVPEQAARTLAARRVTGARQTLITFAGIEADRLEAGRPPSTLGAAGEGRVEFSIRPTG